MYLDGTLLRQRICHRMEDLYDSSAMLEAGSPPLMPQVCDTVWNHDVPEDALDSG